MANMTDFFGTGSRWRQPVVRPPVYAPSGHSLTAGPPGSPPPTHTGPAPTPTMGTGRVPMPVLAPPHNNPPPSASDPQHFVAPGMADIFTPDMKGWLATIEPGSYQFNSLPPMQKAWITAYRGAHTTPTTSIPTGQGNHTVPDPGPNGFPNPPTYGQIGMHQPPAAVMPGYNAPNSAVPPGGIDHGNYGQSVSHNPVANFLHNVGGGPRAAFGKGNHAIPNPPRRSTRINNLTRFLLGV